MSVVFFLYGLAFFLFGFAITLKHDARCPHPLVGVLPILAAFGLLHGLSEWSDMLLSFGDASWTSSALRAIEIVGLYLTVVSFLSLVAFGLTAIVPPSSRRRGLVVLGSCVIVVVITATGIHAAFSPSWRGTTNILARYLFALPGSLLTSVALWRQVASEETRRLDSAALVRSLRGLAIVFAAYGVMAGVVVPPADFFPGNVVNQTWFAEAVGLPIQFFRMAAAGAAAVCVTGILRLFSLSVYGGLDRLARERAEQLATANAELEAELVERRRIEADLERACELALESARAKSEFLANMSHEIRTPMNGVIGMIDLVLDTQLATEQRECVVTARQCAETLLAVLNDILDFSKIEAGKLDLEVVEFDLEETFASALKALAPRAHHKGLELACSIAADIPTRLTGDPHRLRQVINNLLANAIKFTERGEVILRIGLESRSASDVVLTFSVSDTGIGIPLDKQDSIFSPFVQADGSMTRRYGGSGLGLSISSQLVSLLGGRMWLESEPGVGSTFHFTARFRLPTSAAVATAREVVHLRDLPVLVIDDNAVNRTILGSMLEHWGMKPTLAESGRSGLAILRAAERVGGAFSLVLLDAQMPDMDGFTVADEIRRDAALGHATIMLLSSDDREGAAARCRSIGIAAYLVKPVRNSTLLDAILVALGTRTRASVAPTSAPRVVPATRPARRVLVVEDNRVNQLVTRRLLERHGSAVTVVNTGREALTALEAEPDDFDLVLMDVQMPEMDGLETTMAIRERESAAGTRRLPIIALTAHAMKGDRERFLAAGMDDYLAKPVEAKELLEKVERLTRTGSRRMWAPERGV